MTTNISQNSLRFVPMQIEYVIETFWIDHVDSDDDSIYNKLLKFANKYRNDIIVLYLEKIEEGDDDGIAGWEIALDATFEFLNDEVLVSFCLKNNIPLI